MVHQEDNEALQQRLNSKTNEMFELRRQLDRALELAREQDLGFAREKEASAEAEGQLERQGRGLHSCCVLHFSCSVWDLLAT
jgi:hypothetical protein